jgi:acyl dehydratase
MKRTYYEDYIVGDEFETPARTVTEEDVRRFADLTGDHHRLHIDPEFGRASMFGERVSHGLLGMALVNGLTFSGAIDPDYILAFLGVTWKFVAPIRFGDTVRAVVRVASRRPTRKADQGIVVEAIRLVNQRDQLVQEGEFTFLVRRRGEMNP